MKCAEQVAASIPPNTVKIDVSAIPKHEMDALCRVLIRSVTEAFKNPAFAAEYEAWRIKRYGGQAQSVSPYVKKTFKVGNFDP